MTIWTWSLDVTVHVDAVDSTAAVEMVTDALQGQCRSVQIGDVTGTSSAWDVSASALVDRHGVSREDSLTSAHDVVREVIGPGMVIEMWSISSV